MTPYAFHPTPTQINRAFKHARRCLQEVEIHEAFGCEHCRPSTALECKCYAHALTRHDNAQWRAEQWLRKDLTCECRACARPLYDPFAE